MLLYLKLKTIVMKKFIYLFLVVCITYNCSSDDENTPNILGCTDPQATNYNANANSDNGTCLYSIIGDWTVTQYTLSDGTNILASFDYIDYTLYSDDSYIQYAGIPGTNEELVFTGVYSIGGANNSSITFYDDSGTTTVCTILSVNYENISLTFDFDSTTTAYMELVRL